MSSESDLFEGEGLEPEPPARRDGDGTPRQASFQGFGQRESDDESRGATAETRPADDGGPPVPLAAWDAEMATLRSRFPNASDGILFCIHKLQQDPHLTIRDFRGEAELHGIRLGGRALHSARRLLGLDHRPARKREPEPESRPELPKTGMASDVITALRLLEEQTTRETARLREAIRKAVAILQAALDEAEH